MSYFSTQTLENMLQRVRQQKRNSPTTPSWEDFQPQELSFKAPPALDMYEQLQGSVMSTDANATALAMQKAQNKAAWEQLQQARRGKRAANQNMIPLDPVTGQPVPIPQGGNMKGWGKDGVPEVSDIKNLNPNAPIVTMNFRGMNYQVNSQVAPIFQAFLQDLWKMGYRPKSIGGHADRNIAGTNTPSLHSLGFAIDIDPGRNPVYRDDNPRDDIYALPPNVGALAAKYGLQWGGNWSSYKDYMHFSVAYGGRE